MAFAAQSVTHNNKYLSDESYIKWYARLVVSIDDVTTDSWQLLHRCTDEEFGRFYPPSPGLASIVKKIQEESHFYCLDWQKLDYDLYGFWRERTDNSRIDVSLVPCSTLEDPKCRDDTKQDVTDYMGDTWSMLVYHNYNTFNTDGYNDERIIKESILADIRTSNMKEAKAQY